MAKQTKCAAKSATKNAKTKKNVIVSSDIFCEDSKKQSLTVAIVGVDNNADKNLFDNIRSELKKLACIKTVNIIDLGNIDFDKAEIKKTITGIEKKNIHTVFLCEDSEISAEILKIRKTKKSNVSLVLADIVNENRHIAKLSDQTDMELSVIAYQNYFSDNEIIDRLNKKYCTTMRLCEYRNSSSDIEPVLRDSDFLAIDLAAVRHSDGGTEQSPNGLYAEELCQITGYAGLSNKISHINIVCGKQKNIVTDKLTAQAIWHFIDGLANKIIEDPTKNKLKKFIVNVENSSVNLIFYKSDITNRWWMEVPNESKTKIIACTFFDYQRACNKDIPARWIKEMQKMS